MKLVRHLVLYASLALGANAAVADTAALEALREGTMKKLMFHAAPSPAGTASFLDEAGAEISLADFRGQFVLLNFWATWCAPCLKEMPALDRLQAEMGGDRFSVVTVATGRNPVPAINRFFDEKTITHLPKYRDPRQALSREMAVLSLPVTVILDPEGQEIARLFGDADWDSDSAKAIIRALLTGS